MADDAKVDEMLTRHFGTDDMVATIKDYMKHNQNRIGAYYPYKGKTDDEIKVIAMQRAKDQLKAGLKVLRKKFNDQKNW